MRSNEINISIVGDIFPAEFGVTRGYGIKTRILQHKGKPWFDKIKQIVGENDLIIGNLESPLLNSKAEKQDFFGDPIFSEFLKKCGFNIITVANNHILEHGVKGFDETIEILEKMHISVVGHIDDGRPVVLYKQYEDSKLGIANFNSVDMHWFQSNTSFAELNVENVEFALSTMKENGADIKILIFHWGDEYVNIPSIEQRQLAKRFIDIGADLIVGHHPHVIQPYEKYKNGHIIYSLGNFLFDFIQSKNVSIGACCHVTVKDKRIIKVSFSGVELSLKHTIAKMNQSDFDNYFNKINTNYKQLIHFSNKNYSQEYNKTRKGNRFKQRLQMKIHIVVELFHASLEDKFTILKNLYYFYLKRL
jgi:poly-gamma-glutamate synthesis protein (capsule biosynthesis protein)